MDINISVLRKRKWRWREREEKKNNSNLHNTTQNNVTLVPWCDINETAHQRFDSIVKHNKSRQTQQKTKLPSQYFARLDLNNGLKTVHWYDYESE